MTQSSPTESLQMAIIELEIKRKNELMDLKEHIATIHENLKPVNLVKNVIKDITESPDLKSGLGSAAIGMSVGYLIRKLIIRSSTNPIKILFGTLIQSVASNIAAKNSDKIKSAGKFLYSKIAPKKNKHEFAEE